MRLEEIDIAKLGRSFIFSEGDAYLEPVRVSFQDAQLVTASTGEANLYLTANLINSYGQEVRVVCFFEEHVEEKLRAERDKSWSPKPSPFAGDVSGFLSDWVKGVGLTLHRCHVLENAS